jgi:hypothetical protein
MLVVLRPPISLIGLLIALLFAYFLLRQNRIAWFLAIAGQVIATPTYIADLILLLAPQTRRFFSRESAEATVG